ncbi:hypothetical protein FIN97_08140 [Yersinia pestis]|nr:hypothetical protein FIN97_08140 [Yersinia pestis]
MLLKVITYDVIILFVNFKQAYIIHIELNFILSRLPFFERYFLLIYLIENYNYYLLKNYGYT